MSSRADSDTGLANLAVMVGITGIDGSTAGAYLSYEWDEKNNDWSLTADHHMTDESVQLLAEK